MLPTSSSHTVRWIHCVKVVTSDERTGSWKDTPNFHIACEAKEVDKYMRAKEDLFVRLYVE